MLEWNRDAIPRACAMLTGDLIALSCYFATHTEDHRLHRPADSAGHEEWTEREKSQYHGITNCGEKLPADYAADENTDVGTQRSPTVVHRDDRDQPKHDKENGSNPFRNLSLSNYQLPLDRADLTLFSLPVAVSRIYSAPRSLMIVISTAEGPFVISRTKLP